ncbi:hypothetical protein D1007_28045 [Hordeum vulgare]|nr:hypothetical protein D1007_28045 [Hordeum vulgare]
MVETSRDIKSLLESLIKHVDVGQRTADKHVKAQLAFNEQVSSDLAHLRKQVDLTQSNVDEPFVPLDNVGPPLIGTHPTASLSGAAQLCAQQEAYQEETRDTYMVKPPKHYVPRFDGSAPYLWIDWCESYFELYRVSRHNWVTMASLYIEGHAALWLHAFRQAHRALGWQEFCTAVKEEFGPDEFEMEMHKLLQLRQTDTVAAYREEFEGHMHHLLALDASPGPKYFVTQFLLGLRDDLRVVVHLQAPSSITRAFVLARIQEEEMDMPRPRPRQHSMGRPPPPARLPGAQRPAAANDEFA